MKQWMKKGLALCLALAMCLSLAACGGTEEETTDETPAEDTPAAESVNVRVAALKGPTRQTPPATRTNSPWPPPPMRCPPS